MKRRTRRMHRRHRSLPRQPCAPCWTYCALASLILGFVSFHFYYARQRQVFLQAEQGSKVVALRGSTTVVESRDRWISTETQAFNENQAAAKAKNLIIVAGHSVTTSGHLEDANQDERDWYLLPYQIHRGLPQAIVGHIQAGLQAARNDPASLLVFSGGATRATAGPETEGASYFRVTDAQALWPSNVRARTTVEEYATDSFQNLLFSICRFREVTGAYPERITMVSFTFKQRRFETMHAAALRWPSDHFSFVGVDPSPDTGFDLATASQGELENAAQPFEADPYGCHSAVLVEKRKSRDPFHRKAPYELTCPDMKEILYHCGPELIAPEKVPWKQ